MMTRDDAVRVQAAEKLLTACTTYLLPASAAARVGVDPWRLDVAVMRDSLLQMMQRYARTFADADRILRAHDSERRA